MNFSRKKSTRINYYYYYYYYFRIFLLNKMRVAIIEISITKSLPILEKIWKILHLTNLCIQTKANDI